MKESTSRSGTCIGVGLGVLIGATDWSIVQNALPTIQNSLGASIGQLQWIMNSFGLFMTVLLVTMGRLGDIYGRKRIFNLGLLIFGSSPFFNSLWIDCSAGFSGRWFCNADDNLSSAPDTCLP